MRIYVMYQPKKALVVGDYILLPGINFFYPKELPKDGAEENDDGSSSKRSAEEKVPENLCNHATSCDNHAYVLPNYITCAGSALS